MPIDIGVSADTMRVAHHGTAGNCQTDKLPDGTWPATCTCGEGVITLRPPPEEEPPAG
jgi:hypothetical protein